MLHQVLESSFEDLIELFLSELWLLFQLRSRATILTSRLAENCSLRVCSSIPNLSPSPFRPSSLPIPAHTTRPRPLAKSRSISFASPPIIRFFTVSGLHEGGKDRGPMPGRPSTTGESTDNGWAEKRYSGSHARTLPSSQTACGGQIAQWVGVGRKGIRGRADTSHSTALPEPG